MKTERLDIRQESRVTCLTEENFQEQMESIVEPALRKICKSGSLRADIRGGADQKDKGGQGMLYYELYPQETKKGTIVISYGFTESCLKYHEMIYYFYQQGYQVAIMDHRGHGRSLRELEDITIVHVDLFSRYVKDLHHFLESVVKPVAQDKPLYLYAHSMGGCIGAFYLEQYPGDFSRAILNAPMLGLQLGGFPSWAARILCDYKIRRGQGEERLFTQSGFDPQEAFENSSADSRARYDWYLECQKKDPALQTSSSSYYWGREAINAGKFVISRRQARKVQTPVLLFQAERDNLVKPQAQQTFIERIANGRLMQVEGVRHEIYRAPNHVLEAYLEEIFQFYEG